jgi:hypothetical protein
VFPPGLCSIHPAGAGLPAIAAATAATTAATATAATAAIPVTTTAATATTAATTEVIAARGGTKAATAAEVSAAAEAATAATAEATATTAAAEATATAAAAEAAATTTAAEAAFTALAERPTGRARIARGCFRLGAFHVLDQLEVGRLGPAAHFPHLEVVLLTDFGALATKREEGRDMKKHICCCAFHGQETKTTVGIPIFHGARRQMTLHCETV